MVRPAIFTSMVAPLQKRNRPIRVWMPPLNRPVVKPPMVRMSGKKVLTRQPSSRGMTMTPAGNFFIVPRILTLPKTFIRSRSPFVLRTHKGPGTLFSLGRSGPYSNASGVPVCLFPCFLSISHNDFPLYFSYFATHTPLSPLQRHLCCSSNALHCIAHATQYAIPYGLFRPGMIYST